MQLSDFYPEFKGWKDATPDLSANRPPIPDVNSQVSPYLRAPLPLPLQYSPDTLRQSNRPGLSTFRIAPQSPNSFPAINAAAKSAVTAAIATAIANAPPSQGGVTSVGLTMPTPVFASPVSGSPITSSGTLAPAFAPELQNYVFAGPTGTNGNVTLDNITTVTAVAPSTSTVYTASVSVSAANEFVLSVVGLLGASATLPAGFTTAFFAGSPARYIGSFVSTGSGTITASGVTNFAGPVIEFLAAFKSSGGTAPTIRQIATISASSGTHSIAFPSAVLANSTIIAVPFGNVVGAGTAPPGNFTITDSQANTYTQLTNAYKSDATSGLAMFCQMFATPGISAGALTVSATNPSGVWGTPSVYLLEVTGLATGSFLPTFRPLVSADIPNLSASSITSGQLALARGGTNADLSATGGANQVLQQSGVGAAITVGQLAFSNLSGSATYAQLPAVQSSAQSTVGFSATPTFTATNTGSFVITLTGNVTSSTLSGGATGQQVVFVIKQDGAGAHTFVWPTNMKGTGTIAGTVNGYNVQSFTYDGTNWLASSAMQSFT
jgi:hypothetical protein